MRKYISGLAFIVSSFVGGAFAQSIGGSKFLYAAGVAWISLIGSLSGFPSPYACLAGAACYDNNRISITSDNQAAGSTTTGPSGLGVSHTFGGGAMTGNATAISSYLTMNATTGNSAGQYVGQLSIVAASAPDTNAAIWSGNDNVFLGSGATSWLQLIGREIDVAAATGSSVSDKLGLQIIQTSIDAVVGSRSNIGATFNNGSGATGWDCMICAGGYAGNWPMSATGTILGAWAHATARSGGSVPTANAGTTLYGVDFSNVTFASGGAPFLAPLITPASSAATCRQGATEWDASFIYICTATNTWKRATLGTF